MKNLDERGNASFYIIWIVFIMGLMLVLIINICGVFVTKQQASNAAEQASIAATDVLYDGIREAVSDYDQYQIQKFLEANQLGVFPEEQKLSYKIDQQETNLLAVGYSRNEAAIQAIDQVVEAELPGLDEMLETYITDKIRTKLTDIRQVAADVIQRNNGDTSKSEITVFKDERVQVKAVVHFEGQEQEKFLRKIVSDIPQKGSGPKLDFVHRLGWGEATYPLD
ncbi:MAG: pilus assembly protein TadG-related protein [Caldibacillus thermoamylovorans]